MKAVPGICLMLALAYPGWSAAQEHPPPLRITDDVVITYTTRPISAAEAAGVSDNPLNVPVAPSAPKSMHKTLWQSSTGRVRTEFPMGVRITDYQDLKEWAIDSVSGQVRLFEGADQVGMPLEVAGQDKNVTVRRLGVSDVAGLPCTEWLLLFEGRPENEANTVCYAANGLPMRSTQSLGYGIIRVEAIEVTHGRLDLALFIPPSNRSVVRPR